MRQITLFVLDGLYLDAHPEGGAVLPVVEDLRAEAAALTQLLAHVLRHFRVRLRPLEKAPWLETADLLQFPACHAFEGAVHPFDVALLVRQDDGVVRAFRHHCQLPGLRFVREDLRLL